MRLLLLIPLLVVGCVSGPEFTRTTHQLDKNPFYKLTQETICGKAECQGAGALCTFTTPPMEHTTGDWANYTCKIGYTCARRRGDETTPQNTDWGRCYPTHTIEQLADNQE